MLILSEGDVLSLVDMSEAVDIIERATRLQSSGAALLIPRRRIFGRGYVLHLMASSLESSWVAGLKAYISTASRTSFVIILFDSKSGEPLALIEADILGRVRTGAASGVATRYLARRDASTLGLIGAGRQAKTQVLGIAAVRQLDGVLIYSRTRHKAEELAKALSDEGLFTKVVDSYAEACRADIIATATTSREPFLSSEMLREGAHINLIGSNHPFRMEANPEVFSRASLVVTDSKEQAMVESGDLIAATKAGAISWESVHELWEVVENKVYRKNEDDITIFKSHGIALWDIALAKHLYDKASKKGVGRYVEFSGVYPK